MTTLPGLLDRVEVTYGGRTVDAILVGFSTGRFEHGVEREAPAYEVQFDDGSRAWVPMDTVR